MPAIPTFDAKPIEADYSGELGPSTYLAIGFQKVEALGLHRNEQQVDRGEWSADDIDSDLVFCRESGEPIHPQTYNQAFERIIADLQHTHSIIALQAGIPTKVIGERLGHESPAFTLKRYAAPTAN